MVSMSQMEQDLAGKGRSGFYGAWFKASVDAAVEYIKAAPDTSFQFNTNSQGGLDLAHDNHSPSVRELLTVMKSSDHTISSINEAFSAIQNEAIELRRPVTQQKTDEGYVTIIGPVASLNRA